MSDLLAVSDLTVRFGRRLALDRVSFDVPAGETVAVVGPNGAGKTTLFRAVLGALEPSLGSIVSAEPAAYVPQS
ncbi:MAG: branched-chain amino acid transport system ATP-binding protein, partial [Gaiellales bacterium]|nr:branched-chain amino acid transport system ATP-binding protein [Gaiellales bacterium]